MAHDGRPRTRRRRADNAEGRGGAVSGPQLGAAIDTGAVRAADVLRGSLAPEGFVASTGHDHYTALWTRDVAFASMGANLSGDPTLVDGVRRSLLTLSQLQARGGQIPNDYWPRRGCWDFHESGSTDATCLFVIAAAQHLASHPHAALRAQLWPSMRRAHTWLAAQDANQFTLIDSPMGGDWMDSTLQRSGKLLYVNVLYERALRGLAELAPRTVERHRYAGRADLVRRKLNFFLWPEAEGDYSSMLDGVGGPTRATGTTGTDVDFPHPVGPAAHALAVRPDRAYYLSHVEGERRVDECDVLGNVLAVLFGVADPHRARRIMSFLHSSDAVKPYPARSYLNPLPPGDRWGMYKQDLEPLQGRAWRNPPGAYHNAGVWPFIGGLYVLALQRVGLQAQARTAMRQLTSANRLGPAGAPWGFHEWIHSSTGVPGGASPQTWNAGTYLLAYHALRGEPVRI